MALKLGHVPPDRILPSFVFPSISAAAAYAIYGHIRQSGVSTHILAQCTPSSGAYSLPYTGSESVDRALCSLVAVFHALLDVPSNRLFNVDLLFGFGAVILGLAVESARLERNALLSLYIGIVMVAQFATAAVMLPFYWLIFVVTGTARRSPGPGSMIDQRYAESVVFGVCAGYALP